MDSFYGNHKYIYQFWKQNQNWKMNSLACWKTCKLLDNTSKNQPKCNHSIYDYMRFVVVCNYIWKCLQLQDQISTILVILTTMMQLLEFSSYWLDWFYIYFHPLIGWYVSLVAIVTKLDAS
jgi:hypothetical protein